MAGDWIKMRTDLGTSPKVVRMASALKADRFRTIGGLHSVWSLFDAHSDDGEMAGYTPGILDELIGWPGFAAAMIAVEWLVDDGESLSLPRFDTHNGASAKRRAQDADRKRAARAASASKADKARTRGEERRGEESPPEGSSPPPPDPPWPAGVVGVFEGHDEPRTTPNPVAPYAIALTQAGFQCTSYTPDLVEAVQEGVALDHMVQVAGLEACRGKAAGYVIAIARREHREKARPVAEPAPRPMGQQAAAIVELEELKSGRRGLASGRVADGISGAGVLELGSPTSS